MRAPRVVREFCAWRWSPFVALVSSALAFVALAVLLIPSDFASEPPRVVTASELVRPIAPIVPIAPGPIAVVPAARAPTAAPVFEPPTASALPAPALAEPDPAGIVSLDFAAHSEDRGDRPRIGTRLSTADSGH